MAKPKVDTNPGANQYAGLDERIIEYSDLRTGAGGLISLKPTEHGLLVELYAHDANVEIRVGKNRE